MDITPSQLVPEEITVKEFRPLRFWISGSVQDQAVKIRHQLTTIQPGIFSTPDFGDVRNIHVCSVSEVVSHFGTKIYMVTPTYLDQLVEKKISGFYLSERARQRISLCLYDQKIAITGVESQEFISLHNKLVLNGGTPVHPSNVDNMTAISSPKIMDKYVLNAASHGIPIISPDYISFSYTTQKEIQMSDYIVKNFTNITITSSELDPELNKKLKQIVNEGSGTWNDCFDGSIDFIVVDRLSLTKKTLIALENNVPILDYQWIIDHSKRPASIQPYVFNFWSISQSHDIFHGKTFRIDKNVDNQSILMDAIREGNGRFDVNENYCVKLNFSAKDSKSVTPNWILACISQKKTISLDASILYRPFGYENRTNELEGVIFILLELNKEKNDVIDTLKLFGAIVYQKMTKKAKYLICSSENTKKIQKQLKKANELGIKAYPTQWVYELAQTGKIPKNIKEVPTDEAKHFKSMLSSIMNTKAPVRPSQMEKSSSSRNLNEYDSSSETSDSDNDITYHTPSKARKRRNSSKDDELMKLLE